MPPQPPSVECYDHNHRDVFASEAGGTIFYEDPLASLPLALCPDLPSDSCPLCKTSLERFRSDASSSELGGSYLFQDICRSCGYWNHRSGASSASGSVEQKAVSRLLKFDITSLDLPYAELLRWLASHPSDVYYVNPRRFENVVRDVLGEAMQVDFEMTATSRDGGFDLLAYDSDVGKVLVEVKRFAQHRKISVRLVRHLAGVLVRENSSRGIIVSTSDFTRCSVDEAEKYRSEVQDHPLKIDLVTFSKLVPWLGLAALGSRDKFADESYWAEKFESLGRFWLSL